LVAVYQFVSRNVGTERVPAGLPAMSGLRDSRSMPAHRRQSGQQDGFSSAWCL